MDIEKKVMTIKEEIIKEAHQQKEALISKEGKKWAKEYKEFQERLKITEEEINLKYKKEAKKNREQIISRAILDRKQAHRRSIDRCINKVINELIEKLQNYSTTPGYIDFLLEAVIESVTLLEGNSFVIKMRKSDIFLAEKLINNLSKELPDYQFSVQESLRTKSGGLVLEKKNGNEIVEYTFETVINYLKENIAIEIQEEVFA